MASPSASMVSRMLVTAWGFVFLALVLYKTHSQGDDPYRCRALLDTGRWVDPPDSNGDRMPFHQWQPDGCLLHQYSPDDISQCVQNREVMFVGDSTVRQMAEGLVRLLHKSSDIYNDYNISEHANWKITHQDMAVSFVWNPFLQTAGEWNPYRNNDTTPDLTEFIEGAERLLEDQHMPEVVPVHDQEGPVLLLLGAGPWFSESLKQIESELWMERYRDSVKNASELLWGNLKHSFNEPLDPEDGVGSRAFFIPPSHGFLSGESLEEGRDPNVETGQIIKYQDWLRESEKGLSFQMAWALSQVVEGQNKTIKDPTKSGWHFIDDVSDMRTNIMLNYRCNAKIDRDRIDPSRGTCCTDYGFKSQGLSVLVGVGIFLLITCLGLESLDILARRPTPRNRLFNMQSLGAVVLPLLMLHYADRTQMMAKGTKVFDVGSLWCLCIIGFAFGLLSLRQLSTPSAKPEPITAEPEETPLFQNQMDEWKGLIMMMIISLDWVNYESVAGNIAMMVLISGFLFQFTYEHATYFLTTEDYSLARVVKVLLRLNLFTLLVSYFSELKYYNYGLVLQASFFFVLTWATMALKHKQFNDDIRFIFAKIVLSVALLTLFVKSTPSVDWAISLFRFFGVYWNNPARLKEYLTTELFIPYIAMLLAVANYASRKPMRAALGYSFAFVGLLVICIYWASSAKKDVKFSSYKNWHNMISFLPILAFVALRNATATIRNCQSRAMVWLGGCSVELYTLHFHIFLAANAHGVLLTGMFAGDGSFLRDRFRDLVIIAPIFIWVSSYASAGTSSVVNLILPASSQSGSGNVSQVSGDEEKDARGDFDFERNPGQSLFARVIRVSRKMCFLLMRLMARMPSPRDMINSACGRAIFVLLAFWTLNIFVP